MPDRFPHNRRSFLKALTAAGTVAAWTRPAHAAQGTAAPPASAPAGMRKSILISMLPRDLSYEQRFALAREIGFEAIEMRTMERQEEAAEVREAAQKTGLRIHSVMNAAHWDLPLSSADPDVVRRSVQGMETSMRNAVLWGADVVLLVPAVVDAHTPYRDAWTRSQRVIRDELLPRAAEMKVIIGIEEVWNKFLLSPIEFAHYLDELDSPWARAYFDVGNVVKYGYPQDWIRTLGPRTVRVHVKDFVFDRRNGRFAWVNLGEGDIDWPEVRRALGEVGYAGYVTTELSGGDRAYLADVSTRVDRILAGQPPVVRDPKASA
jgi:L-ribulose-5-phosphate 3-epimerase